MADQETPENTQPVKSESTPPKKKLRAPKSKTIPSIKGEPDTVTQTKLRSAEAEITPPFKGDSSGFLVGKPVDGRELTEEFQLIGDKLTGIGKSVAAIEAALTSEGLRVLSGADKPVEPIAAVRSQNERKASTGEKAPSAKEVAVETGKAVERGVTSALKALPKSESAQIAPDGEKPVETVSDATIARVMRETSGATKEPGASIPEISKAAALGGVAEPAPKSRGRRNGNAQGNAEKPVETATRDAKGRFVGKGKNAEGGADDNSMAGYEDDRTASNLASKLADAVREGSDDMRQTDPVVQAIGEVAEPVSHTFGALKGLWAADDGEEGLLKRILSGLTRFRREQSAFNKAEKKTLAGIENNTDDIDKIKAGGSGEGNSFNFLGGPFKNAGGALAKAGAGALKMARKLPLIGSLFAVGKGIFDVANSELDTTTTREQKDKQTGGAIGDAAGIIAGGFAGAKMGALAGSFLGPVGSAIGGVVGSAAGMFFGSSAGKIVGETVGGWVSELRQMDIGGAITNAWDSCAASVQNAWDGAVSGVSNAWNSCTTAVQNTWNGAIVGVSDAWNGAVDAVTGAWTSFTDTLSGAWDSLLSGVAGFWDKAKEGATAQLEGVNNWIKEKTGIDVGGTVSTVAQTVAGAFKGMAGMVKEAVTGKTDAPKSLGLSGKDFDLGVKKAQKKIDPKTWQLGDSSAAFESGGKGAGTISSGRGDRGGKSYGTYQLSSKTGTLRQFLNESPYGKQFEGMQEGSADFDRQWQRLAKNDPAFAQAQHDFIKRTHYDKAVDGLKEAGIDLSGRGKAVQDAIWSTSVQFGAGKKDGKTGAVPLFQKALGGRNLADMSDEQIISAVQDYKLANNDKFFRGSSANIREGTAKRAVLEKERLIALSRLENPAQATAETTDAALPAKGPTIAARAKMEAEKARNVSETEAVEYSRMAHQFGLDERARTDGGDWRKDLGLNNAAAPSPVVSAARIPPAPAVSVNVPAPAKSAPMQTPLNSGNKPSVTAVRVESDAGQDVKERNIAHIVTGGLSG